jgi:hypothetical protein
VEDALPIVKLKILGIIIYTGVLQKGWGCPALCGGINLFKIN